MKGYELKLMIYAEDEAEIADCEKAFADFLEQHRLQGRAVTAKKFAYALRNWDKSVFARAYVINFLK